MLLTSADWLNGAIFLGYETLNGINTTKWDKKGLQDNFYFSTVKGDIPARLDMKPTDVFDFHTTTYNTNPIDPNVFNLPSYCSPQAKCPLISICTIVNRERNAQFKDQL